MRRWLSGTWFTGGIGGAGIMVGPNVLKVFFSSVRYSMIL